MVSKYAFRFVLITVVRWVSKNDALSGSIFLVVGGDLVDHLAYVVGVVPAVWVGVDMGATADDAMDRLFDLAVVLGDLMNRRLAEHGLTPARAEVIWLLHHGGPRTQRELSQALRCTPRNVTGLVDALEAGGFVARRAHPTDRRATVVSLSQRGRPSSHGGTATATMAPHLIGDTSTAELATFVTVLDPVLGNLRAAQQVE
jgi:hypothetical protein